MPPASPAKPPCHPSNAGLSLPAGFCAVLVGENLGAVRHLAVTPNGDVLVAVQGQHGGVLALRDADGDGKAEVRRRFGPGGGTGLALDENHLYFATNNRVARWRWRPGQLQPESQAEVIVRDLPDDGDHTSKSLVLGPGRALYVSVGSASNSCQRRNRMFRSPGQDPCRELETRAGVWRFDADRLGQRQQDGQRFATGLRNAVALATQPGTGRLFAAVHGRDQLGENWGYSDSLNAELPAEEFVLLEAGTDFGWPYCYFDQLQGVKVLAPEYGGDGREVGRCAGMGRPLIGFPGHWGPLAIAFSGGAQFPAEYRGGAFIAFHGSWNRAPLPQQGYRVVFVPFSGHRPSGSYTTFVADELGRTTFRPSGLAVGPDGSLYLAADDNARIWRILTTP